MMKLGIRRIERLSLTDTPCPGLLQWPRSDRRTAGRAVLAGRPEQSRADSRQPHSFLCLTTVFTDISYLLVGLFTREAFFLGTPVYGVALWVGHMMFGMASEKTFRNICYVLIALAILVS